ncbi:MAG: DUF58 domain-containing protein [Chloroflexota bacterium]|nr:DUF58 domain-containing protein [Chloroflexota bacterium]
MTVVRAVFVVLVLLAAAEYTGWPVLDQALGAVVAVLVVAALWSVVSLGGIAVRRDLVADRAQVGDVLVERVTVWNRSRLPKWWLEITDHSSLPGHDASQAVRIGPLGERSWEVRTRCGRRGAFRLGPLSVATSDPLGIFFRRRLLAIGHEVVIYPRLVDVSAMLPPAGRLPRGATASRRLLAHSTSSSTVREYVAGDPMNRISWRTTARTGRLMTKEFESEASADLWLLVDLQRVGQAVGIENARGAAMAIEETIVSLAASLALDALTSGRAVGMICSGGRATVIQPERGDRQRTRFLETLAVVAADGEMPLAERLVVDGPRMRRQDVLVIITASRDAGWVEVGGGIMSRGTPVAVAMVDAADGSGSPGGSRPPVEVVGALAAVDISVHVVPAGYGESPVGPLERRDVIEGTGIGRG